MCFEFSSTGFLGRVKSADRRWCLSLDKRDVRETAGPEAGGACRLDPSPFPSATG